MNTIADRIKHAMRVRYMTDEETYTAAGVKYTTWRDITSGLTARPQKLPEIARALNVSHDWLLDGTGPMPTETDEPASPVSADAYVMVDRVTGASLSAGSGEILWDLEIVEQSHAFQRSWMQQIGAKAERSKLWTVRGDSMAPTIADGSLALINMADREPRAGKVYALITEDGLKAKRLFREGGHWIARSDNPLKHLYPDVQLNEHTSIIGRIVWAASTL